ncbi:molybdopterin-dependent oxidoreductase [Eggerthella guodeyinii]|uniref:Molybdopterin-dependent oxidoreductase n=1 Tax=Eggerthella guodeyinii TaxID=2690837 RepID=A0A6L7IRT1_9ACTN|nr:DMSO/selenate family reductase complex A subunit [Eggerthella guodeyinii]QOS68789.1 molybdopterin-dependent oxidoreductase [Eggerthella guodeyinii]
MTNMLENAQVSRRTFMKGSALAGLGAAAMGTGAVSLFGCSPSADGAKGGDAAATQAVEETTTWGHCAINCPGRCSLKFHVQDDEVAWVETYTSKDAGFDEVQPRACLRGRTYRRWLANPDRINYPMKRVGKRGEGKFEQISWDEAIDTAATKLQEVIDKYGNEAVYVPYATGVSATTSRPFNRMLSLVGGYLNFYNSYSTAQISCITPYMYGSKQSSGSTLSAAEDAALILVFGSSPTETRQGGAVSHYDWAHLREKTSAKIYMIDPRMNDSIMGHSEEWLPINPGTDAALVAGIAHELIANDMVDLDFLHTYCVGYDEETMPEAYQGKNMSYRAYVMGEGYDMVEKTPEWAAKITGIPADRIKSLAEEIGTTHPLYVNQGWGPQRRSNGEWTAWSIMTLPCLVGQIGLPGTSNGTREGSNSVSLSSLPKGDNPVKASIPCFLFTDAIDHGPDMTSKNAGVKGVDQLSTGIKYMINYAGNCLTNQHGDINRAHDILADESKCEFILGIDTAMCDSMKYADIILPDLFRFEQVSQIGTGGDNAYMISGQPCTTPKFERKTAYEMASLMADKLGVKEEFTEGKTEEEWIKSIYEESREKDDTLPTYEEAMEMGVYTRQGKPKIAMEKFRSDPTGSALDTPSGKIEIFSEAVLQFTDGWELTEGDTLPGMDTLPPIPVYIPEWDGVETTTDEYPLALTGFHYRGRLHSSWGGIEELKEVNPQEAWINPADAKERSIKQGDKIRVKNAHGEVELLAKVTPRVVPGTVAISQGAWHDADMSGDRLDKGGSINTLTTQRPSPLSKGNPQHTNICQVTKA